jgi:2-desacetyl-2-hydroxyethyl bacteriochlorophyllide A dehydrogenase
MKAWRFHTVGEGLSLEEVPAARPAENEVLLDVLAAGLCHTDAGVVQGHLGSSSRTTPRTLGHEICGRITELGADVTGWKVGDRVAVAANPDGPGNSRDGGYAEQVVTGTWALVAVPDGVDDATAAAATDAGLTAYHAVVNQGEVKPGMRVGLIGLGGIGLIGARLAVIAGAEVYAADIKETVYPIAVEQGVVACSASITDFADKGLDLIIDFAGANTTASAFKAIRDRGRVVQVGIGRPEATISLFDVLWKQLEYRGSNQGSLEDLATFLNLVNEGKVSPTVERIPFEEIGAGIGRVARGEVTGRLVAVP